ncbi:hypothetical protein [Rhizosaccharibacter radicis]|uniref:DUF2171 domain-containing protein n=1 Tax=Rhizosaccharibacter radicis TaxID=2782605 RepID=A0ABT1W0L8_9PROT|nr:hypothetical protein [Acetobacteraceae bacterium KSS12]
MPSLKIGDRVSALDGSHPGILVDIDGATGYVQQPNGVEVEYPLGRLKPWEAPKAAEQRTLSGPLRDKVLRPEDQALLASVPADLVAAVARSYERSSGTDGARIPFEALPPSKKLDAIRIHLPTLPPALVAPHMRLVLAFRDLGKARR